MFSNPALLRALLLSFFIHVALFSAIKGNPQETSKQQLLPRQGFHATLSKAPKTNLAPITAESEDSVGNSDATDQSTAISAPEPSMRRLVKQMETSVVQSVTTKLPTLIPIEPPRPYYYNSSELDLSPSAKEDHLTASLTPSDNFENGRIVLTLWINDSGGVDGIEVTEAELGTELRTKILGALSKTRFSAGEINGRVVHSQIRMEIVFRQEKTLRSTIPTKHAPQRLVPP